MFWVASDILEFGTYAQSYSRAAEIKRNLIEDGGTDARIEREKRHAFLLEDGDA